MLTEPSRATAVARCPGRVAVAVMTDDPGSSPVESERGHTHASLGGLVRS